MLILNTVIISGSLILAYLNTSYVDIKQNEPIAGIAVAINLNTSYVDIKP